MTFLSSLSPIPGMAPCTSPYLLRLSNLSCPRTFLPPQAISHHTHKCCQCSSSRPYICVLIRPRRCLICVRMPQHTCAPVPCNTFHMTCLSYLSPIPGMTPCTSPYLFVFS